LGHRSPGVGSFFAIERDVRIKTNGAVGSFTHKQRRSYF